MRISVIIPVKNRLRHLHNTLASLAIQTLDKSKYDIIVIDDNSDMIIRRKIIKWNKYFNLFVYRHDKPLGRSGARNYGISKARGEILIFIDNDMICEPDLLKKYYEIFSENRFSNIVVLGKRLSPLFETNFFETITPDAILSNPLMLNKWSEPLLLDSILT